MPRVLCNAISVACQLRKKAAAAEIGRLRVWTNHVKISVVGCSARERSTAQLAHCKYPKEFRCCSSVQSFRCCSSVRWTGHCCNI